MPTPKVTRRRDNTIVIYRYGEKIGTERLGERTNDRFRIFATSIFILTMVAVGAGLSVGHATFAGQPGEVVTVERVVFVKDVPPILKKIAQCESGNKHYGSNGKVVEGKVNPNDKGRYQINVPIWGITAKELGYNLLEEKGNEDFAIWLFENYGTVPWRASSGCWNK